MNKMYEYLEEHNYISKNENKDPLRQQELSTTRAECIANKYDSLTNELQQENRQLNEEYTKVQKMYEDTFRDYQKQKEAVDKIYELIKQHIRKDEFIELNEWQTRDLLNLLKEVSNKYACLLEKGDSNE